MPRIARLREPAVSIHRPTRTVVARFSTWPERWDDRLSRYADVANRAVLERLGAVQRD